MSLTPVFHSQRPTCDAVHDSHVRLAEPGQSPVELELILEEFKTRLADSILDLVLDNLLDQSWGTSAKL